MSEADRLRWRCRRGMKELDVLLERFLATRYAAASSAEKCAFAALLDLPDPELAAYLMGHARSSDPEIAALAERISASRD